MTDSAVDTSPVEATRDLGSAVATPLEIPPPPLLRSAWGVALVFLGFSFALWAVLPSLSAKGTVYTPLLVLSGLCVLAGGGVLRRRRRKACRLELYERGVVVVRRNRRTVIAYDALEGLWVDEAELLLSDGLLPIWVKAGTSAGLAFGLIRTLRLAGPEGEVEVEAITWHQHADEMGDRLERLVADATAAVDRRHTTGGAPLGGDGWTLGADAITAGDWHVPLSALSAMGVFDGKVELWKAGDESPFLRVPITGRNGYLLRETARRILEGRPGGATAPPGRPQEDPAARSVVGAGPVGLGRALFHRAAPPGLAVGLGVLGSIIAAMGAAVAFLGNGKGLVPGLVVLAVGVLLLLSMLIPAFSHFVVYEQGLRKRSVFGGRILRYEEIEGLRYLGQRQQGDLGGYGGTMARIRIVPRDGRPIWLWTSMGSAGDADLIWLRDRVASVIAPKLMKRIEAGEGLPWGRKARLFRDHFTFHGKGPMGTSALRTVPLSGTYKTSSDYLGAWLLFVAGEYGPACRIPDTVEDFYPCLVLFTQLVAEAGGTLTESQLYSHSMVAGGLDETS